MPYRLRTFGGLDLRDSGGEQVEAVLAHSKGMALFAYLVVEGPERGVARSQLAALLWPDREEAVARNALRTTLTRMRQAADESLIEGKGESLLKPARSRVDADVWEFRRALERGDTGQALELYHGDFLAGIRIDDAAPFQRWLDERRERFRDRAYEAASATGRTAREEARLEAAEAAYRRALELRPLREEGAEGLVRTLAERGRTAEALQRFEAFRKRRELELDLAPSEELLSLVEEIREGRMGRPTPRPEPVEPGAPEAGEREATSPRGSESPLWQRAGKVAAAAVVLVAAAFGIRQLGAPGSGRPAVEGPSVAVLPFEAIGTENPGPVAQGLHDDLITRLADVSGVEVISAASVERFRDAGLPLRAIADSLRVEWVLEGEVQQAGDVIRVNAQLVDPSTNTHAWADTYRRDLTAENLFDVMGEISGRVAEVLATRIGNAEKGRLRRRSTGSLDAYRFYVRGRSLLEQRSPPSILRSLDYFGQALAEDSAYALAWSGRADALAILARYPGFASDTLLPQASGAADRAIALAPDLAEAHLARGRLFMYRRDAADALREFERAVELRPSYAAAYAWLAKLRLSIGRPAKALEDAKQAVSLDPLSPETLATLVIARHVDGDIHRVLELARRIEQLTGKPVGHELVALAHLSRLEELRAEFRERGSSISEKPLRALYIIEAGGSASVEEAVATAEEHEDLRTEALLHAVAGREERALDILDRLYPRPEIPWDLDFTIFLRYDSYWPETLGPMRQHPRYHALMRKVDFRWGLDPDGGLSEVSAETAG